MNRRGVRPARWIAGQNRLPGRAKWCPRAADTSDGLMPQNSTSRPGAITSGSGLGTPVSVRHGDRSVTPPRTRGVDIAPFPSSRRLVTAAVRAGRRIQPMHGLLDIDLTEARRLLAAADPPLSTTAFVVASVARAVAAHPAVHAYRDWRGRLVRHRHVDVQTLIEVDTGQGPFGLVHVVRDADLRHAADISTELRAVQARSRAVPRGGRSSVSRRSPATCPASSR